MSDAQLENAGTHLILLKSGFLEGDCPAPLAVKGDPPTVVGSSTTAGLSKHQVLTVCYRDRPKDLDAQLIK